MYLECCSFRRMLWDFHILKEQLSIKRMLQCSVQDCRPMLKIPLLRQQYIVLYNMLYVWFHLVVLLTLHSRKITLSVLFSLSLLCVIELLGIELFFKSVYVLVIKVTSSTKTIKCRYFCLCFVSLYFLCALATIYQCWHYQSLYTNIKI